MFIGSVEPLDCVLRRHQTGSRTVRSLTEAEAKVITVLLAATADGEKEKLRRIEIPRSTYHAARRRAYEEGWLKDRYVPDPSRFGLPWATIVLARPFADRAATLSGLWEADPTHVHTWQSPQLALGVSFHPSSEAAKASIDRLTDRKLSSRTFAVIAPLTEPTIPVYFDFEGLWSHLSMAKGAIAYPVGLGGNPRPDGAPPVSNHLRWAATELVHRPFSAAEAGRGSHLVGPLGLPFSQRRLLAQGWVTHRTLLDPAAVPAFQGRSANDLILLTGELRAGSKPEELFQVLTRECRVYPFLYATFDRQILVGALGAGPSAPNAPRPSPVEPARRPVMPTFQEFVQGIEILSEPVERLTAPVDHRYDRLFPRAVPAGQMAAAG